jgi:hypothetical protein
VETVVSSHVYCLCCMDWCFVLDPSVDGDDSYKCHYSLM